MQKGLREFGKFLTTVENEMNLNENNKPLTNYFNVNKVEYWNA